MERLMSSALYAADVELLEALQTYSNVVRVNAPIGVQLIAVQSLFAAEQKVALLVRMVEWARRCDRYEGGE